MVRQSDNGSIAPVREIADQFNKLYAAEYGERTYRWVGEALRSRLRLETRKSNGVYSIPGTEVPKLDALAHRFGL
jgi:hypothetical protein